MDQIQKYGSKHESHKTNEHRNKQDNFFLKLAISEHFLLDHFSKSSESTPI